MKEPGEEEKLRGRGREGPLMDAPLSEDKDLLSSSEGIDLKSDSCYLYWVPDLAFPSLGWKDGFLSACF